MYDQDVFVYNDTIYVKEEDLDLAIEQDNSDTEDVVSEEKIASVFESEVDVINIKATTSGLFYTQLEILSKDNDWQIKY